MQHKIKILHLEDMETDGRLVERELQKSNVLFEQKLVDTKDAFISALKDFHPDIILSDHSLPAFNSAEALSVMQKSGYDLPFILVTGNVSEEFAVQMMNAGASDYILKDRMQRLPQAVTNAFEKVQLKKIQQQYLDEVIATSLLFSQAEEIAHFGTWKHDIIKGSATWSEETYRLLGYGEDRPTPCLANFIRYIIPEDACMVKDALELPAREYDTINMEFRVIMQDRSIRHICSRFRTERGAGNEVVSITGFNQDITETKLAESALYRSNANLQTIFSHTYTAFILITVDFKVQSYNLQAENFAKDYLHKTLKEGEAALSYFPPERMADILETMQRVLKGAKISYEMDYPGEDAVNKWFDVTWIPIANVMNKELGLILSITDISGRKAAEMEKEKITVEIAHRNKDLQQFAYIVSHNLRSQVSNIMGLSEVFKYMKPEHATPEWKPMIVMLDESCQKLDMVIRDLNHILEIKNNLHEAAENINFSELMESVKKALPINNSTLLDLRFDLAGLESIKGFKSYLHSIFYNLILNSIKFRRDSDPVIIRVNGVKHKERMELIFTDNGRGIDLPKRKDQVFGLYKRFHTDIEGKGMGLFMVKTQVEAMGGTIDIESEVNVGTSFIISLPV